MQEQNEKIKVLCPPSRSRVGGHRTLLAPRPCQRGRSARKGEGVPSSFSRPTSLIKKTEPAVLARGQKALFIVAVVLRRGVFLAPTIVEEQKPTEDDADAGGHCRNRERIYWP